MSLAPRQQELLQVLLAVARIEQWERLTSRDIPLDAEAAALVAKLYRCAHDLGGSLGETAKLPRIELVVRQQGATSEAAMLKRLAGCVWEIHNRCHRDRRSAEAWPETCETHRMLHKLTD